MAYLINQTIPQWLDNNGSPAAGALLYIYTAATLTLLASYTTSALSVAHANPQVADSSGRFANAYIADGTNFKIIITDSTGATTFRETDNIHATDALSSTAINRTYETKVADYTLVAGDNNKFIDFDASGGDRVCTAGSATLGNGYFVTIGRRSTSGLVTITPSGTETIDGAASYVIDTDYEAVTIDSMGATGWRVIGRTSTEPVGELPTLVTDATAARTLQISDKGARIRMTSASANIVTIPTNAAVPFPINSRVEITMAGAGQTTIAAAVGVTINSFSSWLKILGQYTSVIATKVAVNTWDLDGNLTA